MRVGENMEKQKVTARKTYKKIITSKELDKQINKANIQLCDRFLSNYKTKRSPKTINVYKSNYRIFFTWNLLYNDNIFFVDFQKYHFMDFFDFCLNELKWNPNRYNQFHSSLSSFSDWIERYYDDKYPEFRNLVKKIERLDKVNVRPKSVFTKRELNKLSRHLGKQGKIQEQCLLGLIMGTGARISELIRFKTSMIDENNTAFDDLFLETTETLQVKGRGTKGKFIVRYIIKDFFLPYYKQWLPIREKIMKENGQKHQYIFITQSGTPATVSTINKWMAKWDEVLSQHWYAHAGRHFWTTYLLNIGLEKELVQFLQDWSSDTLVDLYNDATAKDRRWKSLSKLKEALALDKINLNNNNNNNEEE